MLTGYYLSSNYLMKKNKTDGKKVIVLELFETAWISDR